MELAFQYAGFDDTRKSVSARARGKTARRNATNKKEEDGAGATERNHLGKVFHTSSTAARSSMKCVALW